MTTECEARLRAAERQLAEARATLKQLSKKMLDFEARECLYLSCEMEVLKEHPSIDDAGAVYLGLCAAMGRLAGMAERISEMATVANDAAGPYPDDVYNTNMVN